MTENYNYPKPISGPPSWVAGYRVLAWAELKRDEGYYPGGIVLTVRDPDREYAVRAAYTKDGGITWAGDNGFYTQDHAAAWEVFVSKCRNLAEA